LGGTIYVNIGRADREERSATWNSAPSSGPRKVTEKLNPDGWSVSFKFQECVQNAGACAEFMGFKLAQELYQYGIPKERHNHLTLRIYFPITFYNNNYDLNSYK
jgi:hypothetical protein